jgi:hypothetical protein
LWKLRDGECKRVLLYAAAYVAIGLWWIAYPMLVSPLVTGPAAVASDANFLTQRVIPLLFNRDPRTVPLTILNLLRFVAWQNLALLPLLLATAPVAVRERGLARALLLGALLWTLFLALVLPEQGRGWGYRYLNGYIGSFALLAGFGYRELERKMGRQADGLVVLLSGATLVVALPILLSTTYAMVQPHVAVDRMIGSQPTPFVLVDDTVTPSLDGRFADNAEDHVRNLPDLSNRPLRFSAANMTPELLVRLCARGPVTLVTRADMHRVGFVANVPARSAEFDALVATATAQAPGCFRRVKMPFTKTS